MALRIIQKNVGIKNVPEKKFFSKALAFGTAGLMLFSGCARPLVVERKSINLNPQQLLDNEVKIIHFENTLKTNFSSFLLKASKEDLTEPVYGEWVITVNDNINHIDEIVTRDRIDKIMSSSLRENGYSTINKDTTTISVYYPVKIPSVIFTHFSKLVQFINYTLEKNSEKYLLSIGLSYEYSFTVSRYMYATFYEKKIGKNITIRIQEIPKSTFSE